MKNRLINAETKPLVFKEQYMNLWVVLDQTRDVISRARELELNTYRLTRAHATLLHLLIRAKRGMTISEIANWNLRELHSVLTLVNRMAKVGLVKKLRDNKTGKISVVATETGINAYLTASRHSIEMIFSAIKPEEEEQLEAILKKLRTRGRKVLGKASNPPSYSKTTQRDKLK